MNKIIFFIFSLICSTTTQAGSVATGGASEITQILNYGELYNQTNTVMSSLQTQMTQLDNMRKQVMAGGAIQNFAATKALFNSVVGTVKQAQGIGYDAQTMAGRFSSLYPDFNQKSGTNYFQQYGAWSKDLNGMLKASMGTANLHVSNFANDAVTAQTLQDKVAAANTSESQIAVTTAASEVALGTYQEMQQMRQMQVVQNAAQSSYLAKQNSEADAKTASDQKISIDLKTNPACYPHCTAGDLLH
ncbi:MAG: hypothetical protein Q8K61_10615 [Gallionella sp.]|nr:hypothetical protein [Gallionella sp.]